MNDNDPSPSDTAAARPAWNKGKIIGPRPPLRPGHVWSIRARWHLERRLRDLALFNLAIDHPVTQRRFSLLDARPITIMPSTPPQL